MTDPTPDPELRRHDATVIDALARGAGARGHDPQTLLPAVYDQLRRLAQLELSRMKPGQTLQATALVHDAWLRIVGGGEAAAAVKFDDRAHFFGAAVRAMRRILVDQARAKSAQKRGGGHARLDNSACEPACFDSPVEDVLALDVALAELEVDHERGARIVQLRFFGGLDHPEIATLLGVSLTTVERDWRYARSWLQRRIRDALPDS